MRKILLLAACLLSAPAFGGDMVSVSAQRANVRSGPGSHYEVVWEAGRHYPLQIVGRKGAWVRVSDYAHDEGWISKSVISEASAVVIVTRKANLRAGKGMDQEILWVLDKECSLKVTGTDRDWYQVTDDDEISGWIHSSVTWGAASEEQEKTEPEKEAGEEAEQGVDSEPEQGAEAEESP